MRMPSSIPPAGKPQTLGEAQRLIASIHPRVTHAQTVPLRDAAGRCLSADVVAPIDLPAFDVAAMDGYAVRSEDLGPDGRASLRLVAEIAAGHPTRRHLRPGETMRIFTGALIPPGADRVVRQESCIRIGDQVTVDAAGQARGHVRSSGEDVRSGQTVLREGTRLGPAQIALLAALRIDAVDVFRPLRVAVLSVGDELFDMGTTPGHGGLVDSNRPMLRGWLEQLGCAVEDLGIAADSADELLARLIDAAARSDLLVTSGGASVGPADHLARLISRRGYLEFWKLRMRPGKPVGFGDIDDCPVLALPGNPFAAATGFHLIGRILLSRLSGDGSCAPTSLFLPLSTAVSKKEGHLQVLAGVLGRASDGRTAVTPLDAQGSANLLAVSRAQGLILLPEGRGGFVPGETVEFVPV